MLQRGMDAASTAMASGARMCTDMPSHFGLGVLPVQARTRVTPRRACPTTPGSFMPRFFRCESVLAAALPWLALGCIAKPAPPPSVAPAPAAALEPAPRTVGVPVDGKCLPPSAPAAEFYGAADFPGKACQARASEL